MEKANLKRQLQESKTKITDQGDVLSVEEKVGNSRINNGYLADRGDSKKVLLKTRTTVDNNINKKRLENKPTHTKPNVVYDIVNTTPNRKMYILTYKDTNKTRETKTHDNLNIKPENIRSRINNYIQNLKLQLDKSKEARDESNVFPKDIKSGPDNSKANVGKTDVNLKPNLVQNNTCKLSLAKTNLGYIISKDYENHKEKINRDLFQQEKPEEFVDSTIKSQINEILRFKKNKQCVNNEDGSKKRNIKTSDAKEKIRERYTIKNKVTSNMPIQNDTTQEKKNQSKDKLDSKSVSTRTRESQKKSENSRHPVITTVRSKNDAKVYKSVTFSDLNPRETTPIEINIPIVKRREQLSDKHTDLSGSIKEKRRKKRYKNHRNILSPELNKKAESPTTEVAKWAPSCVNKLTIPYYEAWIDTTLAAISKKSKKDKYLDKQTLLQSFRNFLERPESPDLVYDHLDEKYTGKIKIRQKHK